MPGEIFTLSLLQPATHLPVAPGSTVVVRGSLRSRHDGSVVDAATTTWPADAPGGSSVDAGGLFDLPAGGFELVAHDAVAHEAELAATGAPAPGCAALGVPSPCLVLRANHLAHSRLLTVREWAESLRGSLSVELEAALAAPTPSESPAAGTQAWWPVLGVALASLAAIVIFAVVVRRWLRSSRRRLTRLIGRIRRAAYRTNPVLAQVLAPALSSTARAVKQGRIDPSSRAGQRLEQALCFVQSGLQKQAAHKRQSEEQRAADELLGQLEVALEAAAEASRAA